MSEMNGNAEGLPTLQGAWQLYRLRRYQQAMDETMKFLGHYPESAEGFCLLALVLGKERKEYKAITAAQTAVKYSPEWSYPQYVLALVALWYDQNDLALGAITEALRLRSEEPDFYELLSSILYSKEEYDASLVQADKGLEYDAQHVGCLYRRALVLYTLNKKRDAEAVFRSVLTIDAEHSNSQGFLGHLEVERGRYAAALPKLRRALRESPDWAMVQNDWKEALRGQYLYYGIAARLKQWAYEKYKLRSIVVLNFIIALLFLIFHSPEMHGLDNIIGCIVIGFPITCVILLVCMPIVSFYLAIVSRLLLFRDRELRRTFSWRQSFRENWTMYCLVGYVVFLILIFLFLSIVK